MSNNKKNIGKTAKEIFDNFEVQPNPEVWTNIEDTIHKLHVAKHHRTLQFVAIACFALVVAVGISAIYYSQNKEYTTGLTNTTAKTNTDELSVTNTTSQTNTQHSYNTTKVAQDSNNTNKQQKTTLPNTPNTTLECQLQNNSILANNISNSSEPNNNTSIEEPHNNTDNNIPDNHQDNITQATTEENIKTNKDIIADNSYITKNELSDTNNVSDDIVSQRYNTFNTKTTTDTDRKGIIYVPTAFTPDKVENNRFFVKGKNIKEYEIRIMSKSKVLVYSSTNINEQWDGTHNGEILEMGIYIYMIVFTDLNNEVHYKNGTITLIRQK